MSKEDQQWLRPYYWRQPWCGWRPSARSLIRPTSWWPSDKPLCRVLLWSAKTKGFASCLRNHSRQESSHRLRLSWNSHPYTQQQATLDRDHPYCGTNVTGCRPGIVVPRRRCCCCSTRNAMRGSSDEEHRVLHDFSLLSAGCAWSGGPGVQTRKKMNRASHD